MSDSRITNEAVMAAAKAVSLDWQNFVPSMRIALEAAVPLLASQPAVDRQALGRAIEQAASDVDLAKYFLPGTTDRFADAVLALINGSAK